MIDGISLNKWNYDRLSAGNNLNEETLTFENNENKQHYVVIINDPNQNLLLMDEDTKKVEGLSIDHQYIVSTNREPPSKNDMPNKYLEFIEGSENIAMVKLDQKLGLQRPVPEQIDLHFSKNLTTGASAESGIYAHDQGQILHLENLDAKKLETDGNKYLR